MRLFPYLPLLCALLVAQLHAAPDATVATDGSGTHLTVQAAVDAAPAGRTASWVILIKPGRYQEHVVVPAEKPFLVLRGEDAATTVITDGRNFNTPTPAGGKYTTPESSTVLIQANNFTAENLTFENSTTREEKIQALALYMTGDRGVFRRCRFLGWQDTLRADSPRRPGGSTEPDAPRPEGNARQYFVDCYIEGHVDFIYAASTAVFERCHIHAKADGYITAASTPQAAALGYVFLDCKVTTGELVQKGVYLGRPWRQYSATAFIRTELAGNIRPEGWHNWGKPASELTARYAEYGSTGPGAQPDKRVTWAKQLTDEEARAYTVEKILAGADGWNPAHDPRFLTQPLVTHLYTADPSAHVFGGRIYLYPSHDIDAGITDRTDGNHYAMRDYHVFSLPQVGGTVTDHGVALKLEDVPWASRQLWAPDAAEAQGRYYLYFPARDREGIFRIGVATGDSPAGPFRPEPKPIDGAFSIDPAAYRDDDGAVYLYFGGIAGGQLQRWADNRYAPDAVLPKGDRPAIAPRVARLRPDMLGLAEPAREIQLLDPAGQPLTAGDEARRFFEGCWVHKYQGIYYLTYSTGTTHQICYATGTSPYGPFTYRGVLLKPVQGWTTHQSIVQSEGRWWLFYHDTQLSGQNNLRNVKVTELHHNPDGTIQTIDPLVRP